MATRVRRAGIKVVSLDRNDQVVFDPENTADQSAFERDEPYDDGLDDVQTEMFQSGLDESVVDDEPVEDGPPSPEEAAGTPEGPSVFDDDDGQSEVEIAVRDTVLHQTVADIEIPTELRLPSDVVDASTDMHGGGPTQMVGSDVVTTQTGRPIGEDDPTVEAPDDADDSVY